LIKNQPFKIKSYSTQNNKSFVRLESIDSIEKVEVLVGETIFIDVNDEEVGSDGYYREDLLGFKVLDLDNQEIGVVSDLIIMPIQSRIEVSTQEKNNGVKNKADKIKVQIPFVDEFVRKVDLEQKAIIVDRFNEFLEL